MEETVLQYRLEKACKNTIGRFFVDEKHELAGCDFGTHKIEIEKNNLVTLKTQGAWARLWATDIHNIFKEGIPKSGQGIHIKADSVDAEIGPTGWHVIEKI